MCGVYTATLLISCRVTEKDMQDMPTALDLLESVQFDNLSRSTDFTELPALTSTTTYQVFAIL